jgi:hypothetical protein
LRSNALTRLKSDEVKHTMPIYKPTISPTTSRYMA